VSSDQLRLISRNYANRDMEKQSSVVALCFNQQSLGTSFVELQVSDGSKEV
jgi:hypothetical protein